MTNQHSNDQSSIMHWALQIEEATRTGFLFFRNTLMKSFVYLFSIFILFSADLTPANANPLAALNCQINKGHGYWQTVDIVIDMGAKIAEINIKPHENAGLSYKVKPVFYAGVPVIVSHTKVITTNHDGYRIDRVNLKIEIIKAPDSGTIYARGQCKVSQVRAPSVKF